MKTDKQLHAFVCYALFLTAFYFSAGYYNFFTSSVIAFTATLLIGLGKEVYDKLSKRGTPEWGDMLWNLIGTCAGLACVWSQYFFHKLIA